MDDRSRGSAVCWVLRSQQCLRCLSKHEPPPPRVEPTPSNACASAQAVCAVELQFLSISVIVLGLAVAVAVALRRLGLPMIIGYMGVGVLVGPEGLDLFSHGEETQLLAELGIVFLMFMVGLDFSVSTLVRARRLVVGRGGAEVLVVGSVAAFILRFVLGIGWGAAAAMGGALAMSSTAIGLKQLSDQGELNSVHGRSVVGVLLFQDLATLPFLVAIPTLARIDGSGVGGLWVDLGRAAAAFFILLAVGRWGLRPIMDRVAATKTDELFVLTALLAVLAATYGAAYSGLSPAIGAFLVGMMMGETRYKHQVASDIRPFRDLLLGLFFVTIGMQLDLQSLPAQWVIVLLVFLGLTVVKGPVIVGLMRALRAEPAESVRIGVVLGHGGEFGLLLTTVALETGLVSPSVGQPILAGLILSMVAAPFMIRANRAIARGVRSPSPASEPDLRHEDPRGHVIICGHGHVGRHVATLLDARDVPFIAVEQDPEQVADAESERHPVLFGDATSRSVMEAAGLHRASCIVVTLDDMPTSLRVVEHALSVRPELAILVSVTKTVDVDAILRAGATAAIPEGLSASLHVGERVLQFLGFDEEEVDDAIGVLRNELESRVASVFEQGPETPSQAAGNG